MKVRSRFVTTITLLLPIVLANLVICKIDLSLETDLLRQAHREKRIKEKELWKMKIRLRNDDN